jgi:outer membrane immunogenic protein
MKISLTKLCLSFTAVIAAVFFATSSFAGPMPQEKNVTPMAPAPECTWTGFYIGINAGVGQLDSKFTDRNGLGYGGTYWATDSFTETAFVGGGQVGYNLQWQDLVFGIEADASGSTADIKRDNFYPYTNPSYKYGDTDQATIDFMGSIRGRLGISLNNNRALLYATAGGAFAHGKWDRHSYYEFNYTPVDYYDADWRGDDWRWGWVGGFGFEYALDCHWSLRGEGLYYWFAENTVGITGPAGNYWATQNGPSYKETFSDAFWTYRVGINYKFGSFFGH